MIEQPFGKWEEPVFALGQRVLAPGNRYAVVRGFYGWHPPMLMYGIEYENGDPTEYHPLSGLAAA